MTNAVKEFIRQRGDFNNRLAFDGVRLHQPWITRDGLTYGANTVALPALGQTCVNDMLDDLLDKSNALRLCAEENK